MFAIIVNPEGLPAFLYMLLRPMGSEKWYKQHNCVMIPVAAQVLSQVNRLCLSTTLWTVAHQAPLSMGFSRQESWSGVPCSPPGVFPIQG